MTSVSISVPMERRKASSGVHTSYDLNKNVQLYGLIKNLFDQRYGLYGTYFEAGEVSEIDVAIGGDGLSDPRSISPSMPFAIYGGVKIKLSDTP